MTEKIGRTRTIRGPKRGLCKVVEFEGLPRQVNSGNELTQTGNGRCEQQLEKSKKERQDEGDKRKGEL